MQSLDDIEVFADFYRAYYESILAFLARRVLDPEIAFDLMSETFAKALERRRQFRGEQRAGGAGVAVRHRTDRAAALLALRKD